MTVPGFTAERGAYRTSGLYTGGLNRHPTKGGEIWAAGNCGYCNCDVGQCCKIGWGGLTCSCDACVAHTLPSEPQFLRA